MTETDRPVNEMNLTEPNAAALWDLLLRDAERATDPARREEALRLLLTASRRGDPEATCRVAELLLLGVLVATDGDSREQAVSLLCHAANHGCARARARLNRVCEERYEETFGDLTPEESPSAEAGGLTDHKGKPIRIRRKGILTPVDAVLVRENGENVLRISVNLFFLEETAPEDFPAFRDAVIRGIRDWSGDYEVFGGQPLRVEVQVTTDSRILDNLIICPVTDSFRDTLQGAARVLATSENRKRMDGLLEDKRSFATLGVAWSVTSRKIICIQSEDGRFTDLEEIRHVAKHEFDHALGLGDLYASSDDGLPGVRRGTYPELDSYAVGESFYNLVMCDHHGPVSNNDVEMVLLAFRDNHIQLYQPGMVRGDVSAALGKGN